MGDRWVANFVLRMRVQMFLSNFKRNFCYEILRYEIFRRNREKCSALQKCLKTEEICSALQISEKSFVYLQRNAFFIG